MQIICAGFPKTGTKSMALALRELGYVVHDFEEHVDFHMDDYLDYFDGVKDSHDLMEKYREVDAVVDQPACTIWLTFLKHYPDAKVILMERESPAVWEASYRKMLNYYIDNYHVWYEDYLVWFSSTQQKWNRLCKRNGIMAVANSDNFWCRDNWSRECWMYQYEIHNAAVKNIVPKDKLLVFKVGEGWERLCDFLGKPVPSSPFPKENVGGKAGNIVDKLQEFQTLKKIEHEVRRGFILTGSCIASVAILASVAYFKPGLISQSLSKAGNWVVSYKVTRFF
eukprot:TRINITY_DN2891_c0_g1_i1.p1 TRINITY_DN2891_c0_g1~~TRINITY_DN2891_c0_g1_i1.p1  ORF type:complete len:294 (+),score=33.28 TRINITY_DN2891_c0_g1_i1:40-882(+)